MKNQILKSVSISIISSLLLIGCGGSETNTNVHLDTIPKNNYPSTKDSINTPPLLDDPSIFNPEKEKGDNNNNEKIDIDYNIEFDKNIDFDNKIGNINENDYLKFELNGLKSEIVVLGSSYEEKGVSIVGLDGLSKTKEVSIKGKVDTNKSGKYILEYTITNGSKTIGLKRYVYVLKNTSPEITLIGESTITTTIGDNTIIPEVNVFDREDGLSIKDKLQLETNLDLSNEGKYFMRYFVTDSNGLSSEVTRTVIVNGRDDIKEDIVIPTSNPYDFKYNLQSYMETKGSVSNSKYKEGILKYDTTRTEGVYGDVEFDYTSKKMKLIDLGDTLQLQFDKKDTFEEVSLKREVSIGDFVLVNGGENQCKLDIHFDEINLSGVNYKDVIKLVCEDKSEAYYQNNKGLILENELRSLSSELSNEVRTFSFEKNIVGMSVGDNSNSISNEFTTENYSSQRLLKTNELSEKYNLNGKGITVGVVDGGNILQSHVEFGDRIELRNDEYMVSDHATHVAGTIASKGINELSKGIASEANIYSIYFKDITLANSLKELSSRDILISNHSYAVNNVYTKMGEYSKTSQRADVAIYQDPKIKSIVGAGNYRDKSGYNYYQGIPVFSNSKNVITVGSIDTNKVINTFSCAGPVKGNNRIKPDLVAQGDTVLSTSSSGVNGYKNSTGTSMSTPAITGLVVLLEEAYSIVNNDTMRVDTVKAIMIQSAEDLGRVGPDYEYGFGLPDAIKSYDIIKSMATKDSLLSDENIKKGYLNTYDLEVVDSLEDVKLTLSWVDPTKRFDWSHDTSVRFELNTDLDLMIEDEYGKIVYAYTLDGNEPESIAVQDKLNTSDNVEQIEVSLPKGNYKVHIVSAKQEMSDNQDYTLVSNIPLKNLQKQDVSNVELKEFERLLFPIN